MVALPGTKGKPIAELGSTSGQCFCPLPCHARRLRVLHAGFRSLVGHGAAQSLGSASEVTMRWVGQQPAPRSRVRLPTVPLRFPGRGFVAAWPVPRRNPATEPGRRAPRARAPPPRDARRAARVGQRFSRLCRMREAHRCARNIERRRTRRFSAPQPATRLAIMARQRLPGQHHSAQRVARSAAWLLRNETLNMLTTRCE